MTYHPSRVIQCRSHPHRTAVSWGGRNFGVQIFFAGISQKVKIIAPLEFELAHSESAIQLFNNYTTETPHHRNWLFLDMEGCITQRRHSPQWKKAVRLIMLWWYFSSFVTRNLVKHVNSSRVILCLVVRESHLLYDLNFFFLYTRFLRVLCLRTVLPNTNKLTP